VKSPVACCLLKTLASHPGVTKSEHPYSAKGPGLRRKVRKCCLLHPIYYISVGKITH
jgi:hypothetical protein